MSERRPSQDTALPGALRPGTERSLVLPSATSYALAADNDQTFMLLGEQDAEHDGTPITNDSSGRVSSLDQTGLAGPLQSSQTVHGKVACQVCQRRKVKCSGQVDGQPIQYSLQCDFCTRNGLQCVWKPPKRNMVNANTRRRPNTAVRHGSSQDSAEGSTSVPQNRSACTECRRRKQRCTGDRPSCRFCAEKGVECSYEVADGMTRSEDLKLKVREATERGDRLDQLVDAMRQGSDQQSSELLARLRVGATLDDLLDPETRLDHFPEYIRNGQVDRAAWLESFGGMPITAAEGSRDPVSTSTTSPSYSFEFSMPPPRLSPKDIDQANNPFNRSFPPS